MVKCARNGGEKMESKGVAVIGAGPAGMFAALKAAEAGAFVTLFEKNEKWLLCNNDGQIIWIVGMRMDDCFKVAPQSEEILMVKFSL